MSEITTDLSDALNLTAAEQDALPGDVRITVPVAENVTDAMDNTPLGHLHQLVYAVLSRRLKMMLDPNSPVGQLLSRTLVSTMQFRAVSPAYSQDAARRPATIQNAGAGSGAYHSKVFGPSPDERIPFTLPLPVDAVPYAQGDDPGIEQNKGLLIARLYADLQQHLPLVLLNITAKQPIPVGIGGASYTRRYWQGGNVISEIAYQASLTVEATCITEGDNDTAQLQSLVEATFGPMRDVVDTGAVVNGRSWQLVLPANITTSPITEIDAPWSGGDDKGSKLYTATVELENLFFECITTVSKPMRLQLSDDAVSAGSLDAPSISVPGETNFEEPIRLKLGQRQRLIINGMPITADVSVSQAKRVVEVVKPGYTGSGQFEIVPKRTGEAILRVYDTPMTASVSNPNLPVGRTESPLFERRVVVTAV